MFIRIPNFAAFVQVPAAVALVTASDRAEQEFFTLLQALKLLEGVPLARKAADASRIRSAMSPRAGKWSGIVYPVGTK